MDNRTELVLALEPKLRKLYVKGLKCAAEFGAVSALSLQRHLEISSQEARDMLQWFTAQGFVANEDTPNGLKTALISEEEAAAIQQNLGLSLLTKSERQRIVDDTLYKACLRFMIKRGKVKENLFMDAFAISRARARAVIDRMYEDKYIGYNEKMNLVVLITKEKYEEVFKEKV